jgi:hypothetical protein
MSLNDLKAEFACTYVRAIAHAAGYYVQECNRTFDGDGVDLTVMARGAGGVVRSPRLDLQVKATAAAVAEDSFPFDLEVKNYDELRAAIHQVPRILVVVVVPGDIQGWVTAREQEIVMRRCGYWISLRGSPPTSNISTTRVRLMRSALFHMADLTSIMMRIRDGGLP